MMDMDGNIQWCSKITHMYIEYCQEDRDNL